MKKESTLSMVGLIVIIVAITLLFLIVNTKFEIRNKSKALILKYQNGEGNDRTKGDTDG